MCIWILLQFLLPQRSGVSKPHQATLLQQMNTSTVYEMGLISGIRAFHKNCSIVIADADLECNSVPKLC